MIKCQHAHTDTELNRLIIVNPGSGNAKASAILDGMFTQPGDRIELLTRDTNLLDVVKQACATGCQRIVAAGGDGTVNAVVNAMMQVSRGKRPLLAILPLGTANDFASTLQLPADIAAVTRLIPQTDNYTSIDIVEARSTNGVRFFANVAAGGNSVRVTEELTPEIKERWGAYCYLRGALSVLGDLECYDVSAIFDEVTVIQLSAWAVIVANGKTNAGRITVAPQAKPDDGLMDVVLIKDGTVADIFELVSGAVFGNYLDCDQVIFRQCRSFVLHSIPGMKFTMDGEVVGEEPLQFSIQPAAIDMLVGPEFF